MRKQLFGTVVAVLAGAGAALAQSPARLPDGPSQYPIASGPVVTGPLAAPVLLPGPGAPQPNGTHMAHAPVADGIVADGGSTGLRPGVDCLPNPCDVCRRHAKWYGDIAYLMMWTKDGNNRSPLITAGPTGGFAILGQPGTTVLYGGRDIDFGLFNGLSGTLGYWFDNRSTFGIEGSAFLTERRSEQFAAFGNGDPNGVVVISRPLIDVTLPPPGEDVFVVAEPGVQVGGVTTSASSRLWGAEGNFVVNCRDHCQQRIDMLAGFRYFDLRETFTINEASTLIGTPNSATAVDAFDCRNQFYGGQLGMRWVLTRGRLSLTSVGKLAMGFTHEVIERLGSTTFIGFGPAPITVQGGQLVLPGNYGRDSRDQFSVLPASSLQLAYQINKHASAFIGYDFLYLSSVVRPGENIDRSLDPAGLPLPSGPGIPTARPQGGVVGSTFYANAVSLGLNFKF